MVRYILFDTAKKMKSKEIIEALTADVERLIALHDSAMEEIASLRKKGEEQSVKIRSLQEQLRDAKAQTAKIAAREAMAGSVSNKAAARAQINRLVREVDKCIALVSSQI